MINLMLGPGTPRHELLYGRFQCTWRTADLDKRRVDLFCNRCATYNDRAVLLVVVAEKRS